MYAKSISGLSQASKSTINEVQSLLGKDFIEIDKTELSPKDRKKLEQYEKIMQNAYKNIGKLFLDNETKNQVKKSYSNVYKAGLMLIQQGSKNLTDDMTTDFFNKWTELINIFENYFDFNSNERYTQFIDETTNKIIEVAKPLSNFAFDENYPKEAKKFKKQAESEQESFNTSIATISQQTYKYFKGKLSTNAFVQTVKQLISSITKFENLFFHQPRDDAKQILYQVQMNLNRIKDAIYDYHNDEPSIAEFDSKLSRITSKLKTLFNIKSLNNSYSDDEYPNYEEEENDESHQKPQQNSMTKREIQEEKNEENVKKRKTSSSSKNTHETEGQLRKEISELKRDIKSINQKISNLQRKNPENNSEDKAKSSDLSFNNDYLNQIIKQMKEFNEEIQEDLTEFSAYNQELEDASSNANQKDETRQKINLSTRKIKREIQNLDEELNSFSEELEKYRQFTTNSLKIKPQKSNKVDVKRAIIELTEKNNGLQSSIDDLKDQEKQLIHQEKEIGTANESKDQVLLDMLNFVGTRKKEIEEIEKQLKNSEPIQKVKRLPQELEAYRNDKFVSNINTEFLNTKKQLEETRETFNTSLSNLNDLYNELLNSLSDENEDSLELYQLELGNKKNKKYIISHDSFYEVIKETEIKHTLKYRIKMIDDWLYEKCPQYNDLDISTSEKLDLLLKDIKSSNQENQD